MSDSIVAVSLLYTKPDPEGELFLAIPTLISTKIFALLEERRKQVEDVLDIRTRRAHKAELRGYVLKQVNYVPCSLEGLL